MKKLKSRKMRTTSECERTEWKIEVDVDRGSYSCRFVQECWVEERSSLNRPTPQLALARSTKSLYLLLFSLTFLSPASTLDDSDRNRTGGTMTTVVPRIDTHSTRVDVINSKQGRILCVADVRGTLSSSLP